MSGPQQPSKPVSLFYSYSHRDEALRDELETHLSLLKRQKVISVWHDRRIAPGEEWAGRIDQNLESADIILLLVSANFIASDYCYGTELTRAMERHEATSARVIPVILKPCDWHSAPFGKIQGLPKDGKPVTSWTNQDEAFLDIATGIRAVAEALARRSATNTPPTSAPSPPPLVPATSPAIDRPALVRTLSGLSPPDFALVVASIEGAGTRVSRQGAIPEQAAELIRWAESPTGPGLDVLRRALDSF